MRWMSARNIAWLLPFLLTACFHRDHAVQNRQLAPALPPSHTTAVATAPVDLPPSATTIPTEPLHSVPASEDQKPIPRHRHRRRAATSAKSTPQVAANDPPSGVSAIGKLSSGDPVNYRSQTEDDLLSIEKGLDGMHRSLSAPEQKTVDHIRDFLKQARTALASGDVDGAHTLAAKAKVLLAELTE